MHTWAAQVGRDIGAVVDVATLWELGRRWYDDRLHLDWQRRTAPHRQAILEEVGLHGPFWALPDGHQP